MDKSRNRRRELLARYGHLYKRLPGLEENVCAYCGQRAVGMDHIPPISALYYKGSEGFDHFWVVPCCNECNSLLSNSEAEDFGARAWHLHVAYRKRYSKILQVQDFTEEELEEMGPNLRSYIEASMDAKRIVRRKLSNLAALLRRQLDLILRNSQ